MASKSIKERLEEVFITELEEQITICDEELNRYSESLSEAELSTVVSKLFRALHSLKGAARSIEKLEIESKCHALENLLSKVKDDQRTFSKTELQKLYEGIDWLKSQGRKLGVKEKANAIAAERVQSSNQEVTDSDSEETHESSVRITTSRIDKIVRQFEELNFASQSNFQVASHVESVLEELKDSHNINLFEIRSHLKTIRKLALYHARNIENRLSLVSSDLSSIRQQPFSVVIQKIQSVIRTAKLDNKQVQLIAEGQHIGLDSMLINKLGYIANHLVRNAIDHGVETSDIRKQVKKSEIATIKVSLTRTKDTVTMFFEDDGNGIDTTRLKNALKSNGFEVPNSRDELLDTIFHAGITTSDQVSKVSGRGVGLDAVYSVIKSLRGNIEVESEQGRGTCFKIQLPVSLYSYEALLFLVNGTQYVIDTQNIVASLQFSKTHLTNIKNQPYYRYKDKQISCLFLRKVLNLDLVSPKHVLVIKSKSRTVALLIDEVTGVQKVINRPTPPALTQSKPIHGATILDNGTIAYTLDAEYLTLSTQQHSNINFKDIHSDKTAEPIRVLVVEDSLTTRMLITETLKGEGFDVDDAANGKKAWSLLQENEYDIVVSDVEMPVMDGFSLTERIRSHNKFRELPVILVTARETKEDQSKGLKAGASHYMRKSQFDQSDLISMIQKLVG